MKNEGLYKETTAQLTDRSTEEISGSQGAGKFLKSLFSLLYLPRHALQTLAFTVVSPQAAAPTSASNWAQNGLRPRS